MILFRRHLVAAFLCGVSALHGGEIKLPPISGKIAGQFRPLKIANTPPLGGVIEIRPSPDGKGNREIEAQFDGPGTRVRVIGNFSTSEDGTWRIVDGALDLAAWFPVAVTASGDVLQGMAATGTVKISGEGEVHAGEASGKIHLTVENARIESRGGWTLEDVGFEGNFEFAMPGPRVKSTEPFDLTIARITTYRFGARSLHARASLNEDRSFAFNEASVEIAGGKVTLDKTTLELSPLLFETTLRIVNVGLQDIAALVPSGLSESNGRINGSIQLGWSAADGFMLGVGELDLAKTEPATVRLAPKPGFLTKSLPQKFGPFANPVYPDMEQIELGRAPLQVDTLTVKLTPQGDEKGRTASVHMTAHPGKANAGVKVLNFDVNVAGPLSEVINLGLKQKENLSIETH